MPTDTAATKSRIGDSPRSRRAVRTEIASWTATKLPVMLAVRVPPSAWMHVAVDLDRARAQLVEVDHRA